MGSNSTQGAAVALFLAAFVFAGWALLSGGLLQWLAFVIGLGASVALFLKAKPWEHQEPAR